MYGLPYPTLSRPCHNAPMTPPAAFISHALNEAQRTLAYISGITQADRNPVTLARTLARRAMAQIVQLEIIVRRLLTLMALALELAVLKPRAVKPAHRQADANAEPLCRKSAAAFRLTGKVASAIGPDLSVLFPCTIRASGPFMAAPLLARLAALQQILADPQAHAKRLARALARQRQAGEAPPMILPMPRVHRMRPGLGLIATALPGLIAEALSGWDNSS